MVAMNVWPTDAADGSVSSEARWRKMGRVWAPSGVILGQGGEMVPTLVYPNLTVKAGSCWVDGHYCELLGDQVLAVTANGLVVVRFDPAANTAQLLYLDGAVAPAQSPTGTFELPIAKIAGSALTDLRGTLVGAGVPFAPQHRALTAAQWSLPATAQSSTPPIVASGGTLGAIGNPRSGFFVPSTPGIYAVAFRLIPSITFSAITFVIGLYSTINQGGSVLADWGTQICGPTPWGVTQNVWLIDFAGQQTPAIEFAFRLWNFSATPATATATLTVDKIADRA